jgi:hypothetical protein
MNSAEFKELSANEKIRALTGIMRTTGDDRKDRDMFITLLTLCNLIVRVEMGDAEMAFLNETIDRYFPPVTTVEDLIKEVQAMAEKEAKPEVDEYAHLTQETIYDQ